MNYLKLLILSAVLCCFTALPDANARPMNVIVVLVDDLGTTDLGCFGSKFYQTPNIDQLARDGMRFTNGYSACTVCSPTRAAMLTGQYPARLHITDWIEGHKRPDAPLSVPDWQMYLSKDTSNMAKILKKAGYATISIGKWHLGKEDYYPENQGFDKNVGGYFRGQPPSYHAPYKIPTLPEGPVGEFLTDREAAEACKFIEEQKDKPFFIYLPHYAVHTPLMAKKEVIEKYRQKIDPKLPHQNPVYAGLVESVDDAMGAIRAKLKDLKLDENTVIIFTSDNGGLLGGGKQPITSNVPFRAGKGSAYEGGVRVPYIVYWPGVTKAGSVSTEPIITVDVLPTVAEIVGAKIPENHVVDGKSLVPLLKGSHSLERDAIYWHYPHYHPGGATPYSAIRKGNYRLVEFFETGNKELYDLANDVGEKVNLTEKMPAKVSELFEDLKKWRTDVGAQLPTKNLNPTPKKKNPPKKKN
ncbi:MAG: sulfatase [Zavarzinella sp.]